MGMLRPGTERLHSHFGCDELPIWALFQQPPGAATITELLPSGGPGSPAFENLPFTDSERSASLVGCVSIWETAEGAGSQAGEHQESWVMPAVQPPSVLLLWGPPVPLGLFSGFCGWCALYPAGQGSGSFGWQSKFYPRGDNN